MFRNQTGPFPLKAQVLRADGLHFCPTVTALPEKIGFGDLTKQGFPFYGGSITFSREVEYLPGDPARLELGGRRAVAEVQVNDGERVKLLFADGCDLSPYLKAGKNTITVTLTNAYRNLLGPHHGREAEPYAVGPTTFSFEKQWTEEGCPDYESRYAFVRFGINV